MKELTFLADILKESYQGKQTCISVAIDTFAQGNRDWEYVAYINKVGNHVFPTMEGLENFVLGRYRSYLEMLDDDDLIYEYKKVFMHRTNETRTVMINHLVENKETRLLAMILNDG